MKHLPNLMHEKPYTYRVGSNQYRAKHRHNLKPGTWVTIGLIIAFFALPVYMGYVNRQLDKKFEMLNKAVTVNVYVPQPYKDPPMAEEPEQQTNISIIKKIWTDAWKVGVAIASCESGLRHDAVNTHNSDGTIDVGLYQINSVHNWREADMMNPIANAAVAYAMYQRQGLTPWKSSEHCWKDRL